MDGATGNSKLPFVAEDHLHQHLWSSSSMNLFHQTPHAHFSNFYPMFSATDKFNEIQNETTQKGDSFTPCEEDDEDEALSGNYSYSHVLAGDQSCCAKSDSDSCSQVDDDDNEEEKEEEVSLDELLQSDAKAKKKIEVLAEMVGVDSTEPVIVLTEVVRVLKHLRRMNHF